MDTTTNFACLKIAQIKLIWWGAYVEEELKSETKLKIAINDFGPENHQNSFTLLHVEIRHYSKIPINHG